MNEPLFTPLRPENIEGYPEYQRSLLEPYEIAMITGAPGTGKSLLVLDMLASLARGHGWLKERIPAAQPRYAAYCVGGGWTSLPYRLMAVAQKYDTTPETLLEHIYIFHHVPLMVERPHPNSDYRAIDSIPTAKRFINDIKSLQRPFPSIVVLDTLSDAMADGKINEEDDMRQALASIEDLQSAFRCAIIVIHNSSRLSSDGRGITLFRDRADLVLETDSCDLLSEKIDPFDYRLSCELIRNQKKFPPVGFNIVTRKHGPVIEWSSSQTAKK